MKTTDAKRPQPGEAETIKRLTEILYAACRRAEENGWTVGQECGANEATKLVEPLYTLLLSDKGKPVLRDSGDKGQERIAALLSKALGTRVVRSRVDVYCDAVDSASWGHPITDEQHAKDSWFAAGWRMGRALETGRKPWRKGHERPSKTKASAS